MAAKSTFQKMVKDDPRNKFAWYDLGVVAGQSGDVKAAGSDYLRAIAIDPRFEGANYAYGRLRYDAADYPAATTYLRRAVAVTPYDANALWYLGLSLTRLHTSATQVEAKKVLARALQLDPTLFKTLVPGSRVGGSTRRRPA